MPKIHYQETRQYTFDFTQYVQRMTEEGIDLEDGEAVMDWLDCNTDHYFFDDQYFCGEFSDEKPVITKTETDFVHNQ